MKMPNVYVGQLADIRYGAIYSNITEAVKEVCRAQQAGMVICFIYLPDSPSGKYWIAGTIGPAANTKWNLIFTSSEDAEKHIEKIAMRGFTKNDLFCKELKINTKGPNVLDIKTEEHFQVERELAAVKAALELGIPYDTLSDKPLTFSYEWEDGVVKLVWPHEETLLLRIPSPGWATPISQRESVLTLTSAAKLLREIAECDPDQQPRKWARLQNAALTFSGTYTPKDSSNDPA